MKKEPYHTALVAGVVKDGRAVERFGLDGSLAFVHDMMAGALPPAFDVCDVFYVEPPWRAGFDVFNARAGVADGRDYDAFMSALCRIVRYTGVPTYVISGKQAGCLSALRPCMIEPITLNGGSSLCFGYHGADLTSPDTDGLLALLADRHQVVGDFVCGYGRTAMAFHRAGKKFVVSDYMPTCIGVLEDRLKRP